MFPRKHRLGSQAAVFTKKRGKGLSGPFLRIKYTPGFENNTRVTVVVGFFLSKRATVRNRVKRQVREMVRPLLPQIKSAVNLMIFAGKGAEKRTFQELQNELLTLLKRAWLIR